MLALAAALVLALVGCDSSTSARPPLPRFTPRPAAPVFYAANADQAVGVEAVSGTSGARLGRIAPAQRDGMQIAGVARGGPDSLVVTYARGPLCTSNVAGCGPRPHTCGAEVVRVDIPTGATTVLWRVGRDELVRDARLSPDGTLLAMLAAPCIPSYFNEHLLIRRMSDGTSWTIGASVPRCHSLRGPEWTGDGRHVVVAYGAATGTTPYRGADGTCTTNRDASLVVVDAMRGQPGIVGVTAQPRPSCSWQSVAADATDVYAIEACGSNELRLDGAASLVRLSMALRVTGRWSIGRCTDGNNVTADGTQGVLLDAYLYCNPPPRGQKLRDPVTVLDRLQGNALRRIANAPRGATGWIDLTW